MDSLSAAAQDVIARGMPLTAAARKHGVPRTTLRWRMAAMDRFNNAKRSEERDRAKHGVGICPKK